MPKSDPQRLECLVIGQAKVRRGSLVRLKLGGKGDVLDFLLNGLTARVESIEQDFEARIFVTVTVDDDPGRDLGIEGKPGHRFFFLPSEVEPL